MKKTQHTPLVQQLILNVIATYATGADGTVLPSEREMAQTLKVSRSPLRNALKELVDLQILEKNDKNKYCLAPEYKSRIGAVEEPQATGIDENTYLQIALDRLDGILPDHITEAGLAKRYKLTRSEATELIRQVSAEGWIAPLPGNGWEFLPTLTSEDSYLQAHRLRAVVEPAAILEPGFALDVEELKQHRQSQLNLAEGKVAEVTPRELFTLNSQFHEYITSGCQNPYFIETIERVDKLRRLLEYRKTLKPERAAERCMEHVRIADLLIDGDLIGASKAMGEHILSVSTEKSR